jgi:hypothetical protein
VKYDTQLVYNNSSYEIVYSIFKRGQAPWPPLGGRTHSADAVSGCVDIWTFKM